MVSSRHSSVGLHDQPASVTNRIAAKLQDLGESARFLKTGDTRNADPGVCSFVRKLSGESPDCFHVARDAAPLIDGSLQDQREIPDGLVVKDCFEARGADVTQPDMLV